MPNPAIIFDAFGTLLQPSEGTHPYRHILKEGIRQDRRPKPDVLRVLMTQPLDLQQAASYFEIEIQPDRMEAIQNGLSAELQNIQPFEDGLRAVEMLQSQGVRVAVCSNLATPYAEPVKRLYPGLDGYGFSFELGAVKPDKLIYHRTCALLGVRHEDYFGTARVLMIGDSPKCDVHGPREAGIRGFFLNRTGVGDFPNLVDFVETVPSQNPGWTNQ